MSRIRTVKPELFKHEDLFDAEYNSGLPLRLAFIGLFTVADCEGRFKWRPRTLKLEVLPHDLIDFATVLNTLENAGFIERYEVNGEAYGWIPSFKKHQRIHTKEAEAGSQIPAPIPKSETSTHPATPQTLPGHCPDIAQATTGTDPGSQEGKGREGNGKGVYRRQRRTHPRLRPRTSNPKQRPKQRQNLRKPRPSRKNALRQAFD